MVTIIGGAKKEASRAKLRAAIKSGRRKTAEGRLRRQGKTEEEIEETLEGKPLPKQTVTTTFVSPAKSQFKDFGTAKGTAVITRKSGEKVYYRDGKVVARETKTGGFQAIQTGVVRGSISGKLGTVKQVSVGGALQFSTPSGFQKVASAVGAKTGETIQFVGRGKKAEVITQEQRAKQAREMVSRKRRSCKIS